MITDIDVKQVEEIKQMLNEKLNQEFSWEIANKIDCLDRLVNNLRIAKHSYKYSSVESKFYTAECPECGWWGSSELLNGGGQIADTGDYGDCFCPVCGNSNLDEKEPDLQFNGNQLFIGLDLVNIKSEYVIGCDTYDDDQYCYTLARKIGDATEILLEKKYRINCKADKDIFYADVNELAEYFNCEVYKDSCDHKN